MFLLYTLRTIFVSYIALYISDFSSSSLELVTDELSEFEFELDFDSDIFY